jgi:hypothetical protein
MPQRVLRASASPPGLEALALCLQCISQLARVVRSTKDSPSQMLTVKLGLESFDAMRPLSARFEAIEVIPGQQLLDPRMVL